MTYASPPLSPHRASRAGVQAPPPIRTTASKTTTRRRRPLSVECRPKGPPPLLLPPTAVGGGQAMPERHEQSTTPRPFVQIPEPPTPGPSPTVTPRGHDGRPQESAAAVEEPLHVGTEVRAADELLTVQATLPAGSRNLRGGCTVIMRRPTIQRMGLRTYAPLPLAAL
jgi:hypothetical protein